MAHNKNLRRDIRWLEKIRTWQLIVLLVLSLFVGATFLRLNRVGVNARMQAVVSADEAGDPVNIQERLYDLQRYSGAHMNAKPEDMYLTKQYQRDVEKSIAAAREASNSHANNILKLADDVCRPQYSGYNQGYVQCVAREQNKYPPSENPDDTVILPNPVSYRHSFTSPLWSADFAGWSLVVSGLLLLVIIVRLLTLALLKFLVKRHYDTI